MVAVRDGPLPAARYVWHGVASKDAGEYPAVNIAITKKPGENAIDVANALMRRIEVLKNTVIPPEVQVAETRNYGASANDKAQKLIQKLLFAKLSVVALVFIALGRREAAIVGTAVILTLTVTLFASWAWGFTLSRVSLFALIFSIGILVDDAIVVVENIHRHQQLSPGKALVEIIPQAVDEVGGPTILATLTVIAALLPIGVRLRPDGAVHEPDPDPDQRQHGHAAVAGNYVYDHAVAGAPVDESSAWNGCQTRAAWPVGSAGVAVRAHLPTLPGRCARDSQPAPARLGDRRADRAVSAAAGYRFGAAEDAAVLQ